MDLHQARSRDHEAKAAESDIPRPHLGQCMFIGQLTQNVAGAQQSTSDFGLVGKRERRCGNELVRFGFRYIPNTAEVFNEAHLTPIIPSSRTGQPGQFPASRRLRRPSLTNYQIRHSLSN